MPAAPRTTGCRQFEALRCSRRHALTVGALGGLGLSLPGLFARQAAAAGDRAGGATTSGRARSVIMMFLHGGHPQHETWDPKPGAPAEVRGEFGTIATALPGVRFGELFPRCAQLADRLTIVRSMCHGNTNHVQACLPAWTGHKHPESVRSRGDFPPSAQDFPPYGAVLDHVRQRAGTNAALPNWVRVGPLMTRNNGTVLHGQLPGFLGRRHGPLIVDQDLQAPDVRVEALPWQDDVPALRLRGRRQLLAEVEAQRRRLGEAAAARELDAHYRRAFDLLTSRRVHEAFDLAAESDATRERYTRTQFGQSCLLARRLAEAGVPFITVHFCKTPRGSWDTHSQNFRKMKSELAPRLDGALAALLEDLQERGLLDHTLVVANAEFGRTPKINRNAGRDHWPFVYSLAMAGAGLRPGTVYGSSDRLAAYPDSCPHDPAEFAATLYHLLGIPADTVLYDAVGRPNHLVVGRPISGILA